MLFKKRTEGICAKEIQVILTDGIVMGVNFVGGCDGQGKTLNALLAGTNPVEAIRKMKQITCGKRKTSCAKELAIFLEELTNGC